MTCGVCLLWTPLSRQDFFIQCQASEISAFSLLIDEISDYSQRPVCRPQNRLGVLVGAWATIRPLSAGKVTVRVGNRESKYTVVLNAVASPLRRSLCLYTDVMRRLPAIRPMTLVRAGEPFSDPDWLFEVKHDGFRALCYVEDGTVKLVSRRGHVYKAFRTLCESITTELRVKDAILDGEIVCLDRDGHSQFNKLMYRRGEPRFYAFDLLWLDGEDLRSWRLLDRKEALRDIIPTKSQRLLYVDHIEERGEDLFRLTCKEGSRRSCCEVETRSVHAR
jgi:hypothetical protein